MTLPLADAIMDDWATAHEGRNIGFTERELLMLAHIQRAIDAVTPPITREDLLTLLADNRSLHAKVKDLTEKVAGLHQAATRYESE